MNRDRKIIFLTGGTGNMGSEAIRHILQLPDPLELRVLVRPQEARLASVKKLLSESNVTIVWGDLTDPASLEEGIRNADVVLHVGGLVSPMADYLEPAAVEAVNVNGAANIIAAIKHVADPERTRLAYIGTVAQTGSRNSPVHWGRTGDPIKISAYDHYAISKTKAEVLVAESGLRYWVSLRQSGMLHNNMSKDLDPIMFHNVLNGVFEWSTANDSGRLMAGVCSDDVPEVFWRRFYNIGGGVQSRITNKKFFELTMSTMGVKDFRTIFRPHWFATQNFHGQWYSDSDELEALVPYREQSVDAFFVERSRQTPRYLKWAGRLAPGAIHKRLGKLAEGPHGTLHWFAHNDEDRISAHFGSREAWESIPRDWDSYTFISPSMEPTELQHGYNENKALEDITEEDLADAAEFRGGHSPKGCIDSPYAPVAWRCAEGHEFLLSTNAVVKGGHWCPVCSYDYKSYARQAAVNPFFAQVWTEEASV